MKNFDQNLKERVISDYLSEGGTYRQLQAKYGILGRDSLVFAFVDDESISQNFSATEKCDFQKNERDVKPSHFLIFMQDFRKLKSVNSAKILNRMAD